MHLKIALAAVAAGLLAGAPGLAVAKSPEPTAKTPRHCFWTRQINSFASSDDRIVNIRVGVKDVYQFEMFGRCTEVDWSNNVAIVSRGSSHICTGLDAELITPTSIGPQRCAVSKIRKLTPEEIKALPKHAQALNAMERRHGRRSWSPPAGGALSRSI